MDRMALERVAPESVGVSSRMLLEMVRQLEQCGTEMHGIMVARHGKVILEAGGRHIPHKPFIFAIPSENPMWPRRWERPARMAF